MRAKDMRDMKVFGFVKGAVDGVRFYTLKANAPKRGAVTVLAGKLGTLGKRRVYGFAERADMREFVAKAVERRLDAGYTQIA